MATEILILLLGLALIVAGAEILVDGASALARKLGVKEFVIGLTIIGMGTSLPEMVVSFMGAADGNSSISLGNIIGSNIMNTLLIAGMTAVVFPIAISRTNKYEDMPANILAVFLLFVLGMSHTLFGFGDNVLSRMDGLLMLVLFSGYIFFSFKRAKDKDKDNVNKSQSTKVRSIFLSVMMIASGLLALVFGGRILVSSATAIAKSFGISDKFIALTILAGGTSLPELATCIVAATKKKAALALGNVIGSNIFNIMLILGGSALIHPLSFESVDFVDSGVLALSALLLFFSAYTGEKDRLDRFDACIFLLCEAAYLVWLFVNLKK